MKVNIHQSMFGILTKVLLCILLSLHQVSAQRVGTNSTMADDGTPSIPYPFPGIPDNDEQADRNCRLLGPFAIFVQLIMGVLVVGTLVLKRQREKPKRPWKIWMLDISKQMLGQLFVHILNVLLSWLGSRASEGENNPCSLYFLNIAIDTTIGVLFIYYCMKFLTHYFTDVLGWPGFVSGQYSSTPSVIGRRRRAGPRRMSNSVPADENASTNGLPDMTRNGSSRSVSTTKSSRPRMSFFFRQLAMYLLSLLLMKIMVLILFGIFPFLFDIGRWVLNLFGDRKKAQVFFVMALFPLAMNTLQFWLIDSVLRHNPNTSKYRSEEDDQLTGAAGQGDDEDDDDIEQGREEEEGRRSGSLDGPLGASWWKNLFGGKRDGSGDAGRGRYQEIDRHMLGEASDESDEDHSYPPRGSQSSSIAQLDAIDNTNKTIDQETKVPKKTTKAKKSTDLSYGATVGSPPLKAQQKGTHKNGTQDVEAEQESWDAWSEDEETPQSISIK
jgi:STIMATE family